MKAANKSKIFFAAGFLLCFFVLLRGLDKPFLSPLVSEMQFVNPAVAAKSENCLVVADKQRNRMLIGNCRDELISIVDMSSNESPVEKIDGIAIYKDVIYITGSVHYDAGAYLSSEKIVTYDKKGKFIKEIFRKEYKKDEFVTRQEFNSIIVSDKGIQVCLVKDDTVSLAVIDEIAGRMKDERSFDVGEPIYVARALPELKSLVILTKSRNYYLISENNIIQGPSSKYEVQQSLVEMWDKKSPQMKYKNYCPLDGKFSFAYGEDSQMRYATSVSPETHECNFLDVRNDKMFILTSMKISPWLRFRMILRSLALLSFALGIGYGVMKISAKTKWKGKGVALSVICTILVSVVFYSLFSFNQMKEQYAQNVRTQTSQLSYLISELLKDEVTPKDINDFFSGTGGDKLTDKVQTMVTELCNAHGTEYSLSARVGLLDENGNLFTIADSRDNIIPGLKAVKFRNSFILSQDEKSLNRISVDYTDFLCNADFIYNAAGEKIGIVVVGCYEDNLKKTAVSNALDMFLKLTCIFIALFVSVSSVRTFSKDIKRRRSRNRSDAISRAVDLSGILMFVFALATFLDDVVVIFVVQNLCADMPVGKQATMVALSLAAMEAGCWLGSFVIPKLRTKLSNRTLSLSSCIAGIISLLLIIYSIRISSIVFFAVGKLIYGFFVLGILSMIVENLPLYSPDEKSVTQALESSRNANIAASVLAILAGGYIADYISYSSVYIISAGLTLFLFILSLIVFEKGTALSAPDTQTTSFAGGWKLFGTSSMLVFSLCFVLPRMLAMGYCDYLFPFISAICGLSALLVSNLKVFSRAICYFFGDAIGKITETSNTNRTIQLSMLTMSATLLIFLISPNMIWSIAAFFIINIAYRFTNTPAIMYVRNAAQKYDCDSIQAVSNYTTAENALYISQSPVLSAVLLLGNNAACAALGAVCGILTSIFALFNRKSGQIRQEDGDKTQQGGK